MTPATLLPAGPFTTYGTPSGDLRVRIECSDPRCPRRLTGTADGYAAAFQTLQRRATAQGWAFNPTRCPRHAPRPAVR